jgi:uncharacterized membrane protein
MDSVLARNIRVLQQRRLEERSRAGHQERLAVAIARFTGSMPFVYLHIAAYGLWIVFDAGIVPGIPRFDPTFAMLAMVASIEALFLTTFVLITQNRMAAEADRRAELDLQITLLSEHEITRIVAIVSAIGERMGIDTGIYPELDELKEDVAPEVVLDEIEKHEDAPN